METSLLASTTHLRADRTRRAPLPTHEPNSDFGQGFAPGPPILLQHTPALAHNALEPQAIARRRAFRKATNRFALVCTGLHRFAHNARQAPQQYGEALAGSVWGFGTVSPSALGRQPPPRSTSRPPARAGPRLSRPLGRSHLSVGKINPGVMGL